MAPSCPVRAYHDICAEYAKAQWLGKSLGDDLPLRQFKFSFELENYGADISREHSTNVCEGMISQLASYASNSEAFADPGHPEISSDLAVPT